MSDIDSLKVELGLNVIQGKWLETKVEQLIESEVRRAREKQLDTLFPGHKIYNNPNYTFIVSLKDVKSLREGK